ncbi:MAG: WXG100 family type VII secretion target [Bacilli bacterium]|nr:WXG100 family type VII secretion target [Bacilli bacterium]
MGSSLQVDTAAAAGYAAKITSLVGELGPKIVEMDTKMSSVTSSWKDKAGQALVTKYNSFSADAKKINTELEKHAKFVSDRASGFDKALSDALSKMV